MRVGDLILVEIEKATAGGRMLARHHGQVVLVAGAIPGERVSSRITRIAKGVAFADVAEVHAASTDRRNPSGDPRCGGNVFAHIVPERQARLKGEILDDAFRRVGRLSLPVIPEVVGSSEVGYRMRARLHAQNGVIGFLRESSHELCDPRGTGQLLPATVEWLATVQAAIQAHGLDGLRAIELAENVAATERAAHLDIAAGDDPARYAPLGAGLSGLSAQQVDALDVVPLSGTPAVEDHLRVSRGGASGSLVLTRDARAFFQGNRYLLERLVNHVVGLVEPGPVVDLYAGVGVFGLSAAAIGHDVVTLVEGDRISAGSLVTNAARFEAPGVQTERMSVEQFLTSDRTSERDETIILDPPRTGVSAEAMRALIRRRARRLVYVSCDAATLARDARALVDTGYELRDIRGFDLFPNTAHVESVSLFTR